MAVPSRHRAVTAFRDIVIERFGSLIERVILYGSTARNEAHEESDIDILVVSKNDVTFDLQRHLSYLAFDIGLEYGVVISVQVYSAGHIDDHADFSFFQAIESEGIVLA